MHSISNLSKSSLFLIVYCSFFVAVNAQYLHGPSDIQALMEKSKLDYQLDSTFNPQVFRDFPVIEQVDVQDTVFRTVPKLQKSHTLAKKAKENKNYKKALTFWQEILDEYPNETTIWMEIAATYQVMEKWDKATIIYKRIIAEKKFSYAAHLQLAHCLEYQNKILEARTHFLLAHLYNRNNMEIQVNLQSILEKQGLIYNDWLFSPEYQILLSESQQDVLVAYDDSFWKSYACCKAVWQFEASHSSTMQHISNINTIDIIEEKECLFNLIADSKKGSDQQNQILTALSKAILTNQLDNFILYEIHLREKPELAFALTDIVLDNLIDYILEIRITK